jgi:hypothetical protein
MRILKRNKLAMITEMDVTEIKELLFIRVNILILEGKIKKKTSERSYIYRNTFKMNSMTPAGVTYSRVYAFSINIKSLWDLIQIKRYFRIKKLSNN